MTNINNASAKRTTNMSGVISEVKEGDLFICEHNDYFVLRVQDEDNTGTKLVKSNRKVRYLKLAFQNAWLHNNTTSHSKSYKEFVDMFIGHNFTQVHAGQDVKR